MASEIEEIVEINDNTKKNENNDSDHSNGDINGNSDHDRGEDKKEDGRKFPLRDCCSSSSPIAPEIEEIFDFNDNTKKKNDSYVDRAEDKKEDGWKGTSTKVLCYPLRLARSMITTRREKSNSKKHKKFENKSVHGVDSSADPPNPESDEHLPNSPPPYQSQQILEFRQSFDNLELQEKKCLSTFILFPENTVVKKRQLVYLWIGEGFFDDLRIQEKTLEECATGILNKLMEKRLVLQVKKNCQNVVNSFEIPPHVRSGMIELAQEDIRFGGNMSSWYDGWVYLLKNQKKVFDSDVHSGMTSVLDSRFDEKVFPWLHDEPQLLQPQNQEKVKTLFNVGKGSLDFKLESFPKMKNVKVLYLGRWQSSAEGHHIEVADSELLKGLKNMENLRFLSLQGISGIQELPGRSISSLGNLRILDLRACYNLEKLPKEIASLKKLTHLDISECFLLDCMPKELLSLSELQVLKGFVITDTKNSNFCTLAELAGLEKLTKLSVNLNSVNFSIDNFLAVLKFDKLQKLKITWGGKFSNVNRNKKSKQENGEAKSKAKEDDIKRSLTRLKNAVGKVNLEKLELQCLPHKTLPNWVNPDILKKLKKLYIRGGGLKTLSRIQEGDQKWEVEALRLKYLNEFNMNWIELMALFPHLQYFEKFKCPKLTLCPCDCTGVWVKSSTKESPPLSQTTS
ncbi:hypothetical protein LWI29_013298 [Acer saccharum]|uniref:Disease resistance RPP13-like protein 4 n=1 Tax=Acer saccharum TaxID=4024 RepID=A0AA39SZG1_ACESA|nr:hypothetical protein LWI29_013298 [Acer saccharum]